MPSKSTTKKSSKKDTIGCVGYLKNGLLKQGCVVVFKSDEKKPESFLEKMKKIYGQSLTANVSATSEYDDKFTELKEKLTESKAHIEDQEYPEDNYFLATGVTTHSLDDTLRELTGCNINRLGDKKIKEKDDDAGDEKEEKKDKKEKNDTKKKSKKEESDGEESAKEESEDEKPTKGKNDSKKETKKETKKGKKEESDAEPSDNEKEESASEAEIQDDKPMKAAKKSSSKAKGK